LRRGVWLAICDGKKALLVENTGDATYPKLEMREVFENVNPSSHMQGSDRPGHNISSGGRRSANEETDFHDVAERAFLIDFARRVEAAIRERDIRSLVLIAPARALGMIRPALAVDVHRIIAKEIDRDYVKLPLYEIERHLQKLS
jgi:protein required for attachment to host cells